MTDLSIKVERDKCQGFGKCVHWAPDTFSLDADSKVVLGDPNATSDDVMLVRAAKSCPYRVITVTGADGEQIVPPVRKARPA